MIIQRPTRKILGLLTISGVLLFVAACSKTVVRENILSSIETGIGLTVAENKQTQMYELKAGYIRSQFYSIPTGKVVETENPATFPTISSCTKTKNNSADQAEGKGTTAFLSMSTCKMLIANTKSEHISNRADITPELVSGIRAHSGLQDILFGMDVSENFAVGKEAVKSRAAVAMYIAMAKDPENAQAASEATGYASLKDPELLKDQSDLDTLLKKKLKAGSTCNGKTYTEEKTRDCANALADKKGKTLKTIRRKGGKDLEGLIEELEKLTED